MKNEVQEIQGLYEPFSLPERVLQKLWLKGDFDQSNLRTESGKKMRILNPGRWNLLEGPDFLEARLELDGETVVGDVEVHFDCSGWHLHGHESNPNFDRVCLHVVLFAGNHPGPKVRTSRGTIPELFCLMPHLDRDLEDHVIDEALLELEQVEDTQWMLDFQQRPLDARRAILREGAQHRWHVKVDFARKRLERAAWRQVCHESCLEVLGYARNRAPMSRVAQQYSIEDFADGVADAERLFERFREDWRMSGLRPANHPRHRLAQYEAICRADPAWPDRLKEFLQHMKPAEPSLSGAAFRRSQGLPHLIERLSDEVFAGMISTKRLNTLVCDACLPLAQAAGLSDLSTYWTHWPAGDAPDRLVRFLKQSQVIDRAEPFSNGQLQGGLRLMLNH